jgi:hypothetical protein
VLAHHVLQDGAPRLATDVRAPRASQPVRTSWRPRRVQV